MERWHEQHGSCPSPSRMARMLDRGRTLIRLGLLLAGGLAISVALSAAEPAAPAPVDATNMVVNAAPGAPATQPDPTGTATGGVADVTAAKAGAPTVGEIAADLGHTKVGLNMIWVLLTGFLVFFMQAGFAMVETGFTRAKNAAHTMAMNMLIYPLAALAFWVCGFAIMFGGMGPIATLGGFAGLNKEIAITLFGKSFGLFGGTGFFLKTAGSYSVAVAALFLFQTVFMDATATIPTGAMAERWKFKAFAIYGVIVGAILYPVYGNWVWGGGWLSQLGVNFHLGHGHVDFAGSSVVHMAGGVLALVGAWFIGPRFGKFDAEGKPKAIPGHNIPMAVIGTMILCFGWFGFNPGSTLAGADLRTAVVALNTMLASLTGGLMSTLWMWNVRTKKPDPGMMCNGVLAGLVAITAPSAFVSPIGAAIIGLVAGILVVETAYFVEGKLKVDDPVGAVAVHGANGLWGCLAIGLFADGTYGDGLNGVAGAVRGLFYGGGWSQFSAEFIGVLVNFIWFAATGYAVYWILDKTVGMRSKLEDEIQGLDVPELGSAAYIGSETSLLG